MFAASKGASGGVLRTTTFTSNTTWVAPLTTNNLITAVGEGADGTAPYWSALNSVGGFVYANSYCDGSLPVYGSSLDYSVPYGEAQALQTYASGWSTVSQSVSFTRLNVYYWCPTSSQWIYQPLTFFGTVRRVGTVGISGNMPTSGTVPTPPGSPSREAFLTNIEFYTGPGTGNPSTGFGKSFPGGTDGPATPTTYNNVSVTPGASYSIVVPSGGFITITYIG